jgi:hypothetical protein
MNVYLVIIEGQWVETAIRSAHYTEQEANDAAQTYNTQQGPSAGWYGTGLCRVEVQTIREPGCDFLTKG